MKLVKYSAAAALLLSVGAAGFTLDANAADKTVNTQGKISLEADTSGGQPTDPVDPTKPVKPTDPEGPGTSGPLSIDVATNFNFESGKVSTKDETYKALPTKVETESGAIEERPNYVQVTDKRGGQKGWTLSLVQNGQFKAATSGNELAGAEITIKNMETVATPGTLATAPSIAPSSVTLSSTGASTNTILAADEDEGGGTWISRFGDLSTMGDSVELKIPGKSVQEADQYTTSLTWTLSETPANTTP
ncbi:MAG: WxL domain-containing protein [Kurthia sp.]|nr:WxL domain-containing protein [Candidatus Kurthia equi]